MICGISIETNGNRNLEAHRHGGPLAFLLQQSPSYVKKCLKHMMDGNSDPMKSNEDKTMPKTLIYAGIGMVQSGIPA